MGRVYTSKSQVPFTKDVELAVFNRLDPDAAKCWGEMACVGGEKQETGSGLGAGHCRAHFSGAGGLKTTSLSKQYYMVFMPK